MKADKLLISVIVCTYNRCESLRLTLDSLLQQEYDCNLDYEIIIVDNNSNDKTKSTVESFASYFNNQIRYIFEVKQGLPNARNKGIGEAKGNIIAFTDDDCIVDKKWLGVINKIMGNEEVQCATGKIIPIWKNSPPSWFSSRIKTVLPDIDEGEEIKIVNNVTGANMIFKKEIFEKIGLFDTFYTIAEDTIFSLRVKKMFPIWYYPTLKIFHSIEDKRTTKEYFRKWYSRSGISIAIIESRFKLPNKTFFRIPLWIYKKFIRDCVLYLINIFNERSKFYHELQIYRFLSYSYYKFRNK